mgnify:CR=1 FL=1
MKPLTTDEIAPYLPQVAGWVLENDAKKISRTFLFDDFVKALKFVNAVGDIAENQSHHPDIFISYNRVTLTIFTHSIGALTENDFILAAKIDQLMQQINFAQAKHSPDAFGAVE